MNPTVIDLLGHVFYVFIFAGILLLARKRVSGWVFRFIGEVGWMLLGVALGMSSVVIWGIIFTVMDLYGFWSWRKSAAAALQ